MDRVLDTAGLYLKRAQDRTHRAVAPILNEALSKRLPNVTSGRYTTARVDPETLRVQVSGDGEHWRDAARLSHGTAEQVYLLLRIAMAERIAHNGEVCPLLLDDVTVQSDRHRTLAILEALHVLSEERQVVLFSQEQGVLEWAQSNLTRSDDQIIILDPLVVPV